MRKTPVRADFVTDKASLLFAIEDYIRFYSKEHTSINFVVAIHPHLILDILLVYLTRGISIGVVYVFPRFACSTGSRPIINRIVSGILHKTTDTILLKSFRSKSLFPLKNDDTHDSHSHANDFRPHKFSFLNAKPPKKFNNISD